MAVYGELLLLSDPVATAVYVVVCVGLSARVPAARGLMITVRAAKPVEAVMVTVVEVVALQLSVTLCPFVIVFVFAEKIRVGRPELLCEGLPPAPLHAQRPKRAQMRPPKPTLQRKNFSFILPRPCFRVRGSAAVLVARVATGKP
jgi:hypothetical protein